MTAQAPDSFHYRNRNFAVAGISEGKLFEPALLGLEPAGTCSACWRGYRAVFAIHDSHLVLETLHVNLIHRVEGKLGGDRIEGPIITGIAPTAQGKERSIFNNHYDGLKYKIEYSGGLLLADGFIQGLYVHMGFHPAWKYKNVIELVFDKGVLTGEFDRSEKMAELRAMAINTKSTQHTAGDLPSEDEIRDFVERAFDQSYQSRDIKERFREFDRREASLPLSPPPEISSDERASEASKPIDTIRPLIIDELVWRQRRMWYIRTTIGVLLFGFLAWRYDWGKWAALAYLPFPIFSWWALSRLAGGKGK